MNPKLYLLFVVLIMAVMVMAIYPSVQAPKRNGPYIENGVKVKPWVQLDR